MPTEPTAGTTVGFRMPAAHVASNDVATGQISADVRRGFVDHTRYRTLSVLRTIEAVFNLHPLNIDAARRLQRTMPRTAKRYSAAVPPAPWLWSGPIQTV